jgi:3',5'-cyclic AMP phosphodiesterase CpdA
MKPLLNICLLILFFSASMLKSVARPDTLSFVHITDLHVIFNLDAYQKNLAQSRKHFGQGEVPLKEFLKTIPRKTNSNLVIATGDLVDFYEGEARRGGMLDLQVEQIYRLIRSCHVPVLLTLGNHDISAYRWKDTLRSATQNVAGQARATWMRSFPCFRDGTYYSRIFEVNGRTYRLIFLDNGYNTVFHGEHGTLPYIDKAQLHWLGDQLQQSPYDVEIVLMHLPLTSTIVAAGSSNEIYTVLANHPSARLILAGHNHKNAIQSFSSKENNKMVQVQTGAFGQNPENWRLIRLTKENILVSFPGKTETELIIPVK